MKKTILKTRIFAAILSVTTVLSVSAMALTTASAATISTGESTADTFVNTSYQVGLSAIRSFVPGGQMIAAGVDTLLGSLLSSGTSLGDINKNINQLREEISAEFNEVKKQISDSTNEIENKIVDQTIISNKGTSFDTLMTALKITSSQINTISNDTTLNNQEKAVEIASLIGKNTEWNKTSNLLFQYNDLINTLSSDTFADQKNRDLFGVIYNDCKSTSMFSGEAVYQATPYVERVLLLGLYAYSINAQCLKAAQEVSGFTAEDEAALNSDELANYRSIKSLTSVINNTVDEINDMMFNADIENSVVTHLNSFLGTERLEFINLNTTSVLYKANLKTLYHASFNGYEYYYEMVSNAYNNFTNNTMSNSDLNALINHVKSYYPDMSFVDYLAMVGFNIDYLSDNNILTCSDASRMDAPSVSGVIKFDFYYTGYTITTLNKIDSLHFYTMSGNIFKQTVSYDAVNADKIITCFDPA